MPNPLSFLLLRAAEAEVGIAIRVSDPQLIRNRLYAELRSNPGLPPIAIIQPPIEAESTLWLVKKEAKNGARED